MRNWIEYPQNYYRFLSLTKRTFKWFLVCLVLTVIIYKIKTDIHKQHIILFKDLFSYPFLMGFLLLSICTQLIETLKWRATISSLTKLTITNALGQSLCAQAAAIVTPNKIGGFAIKVLFYPKKHYRKILLLNTLHNAHQQAITVLIGCIGIYLYWSIYPNIIIPLDWLTFISSTLVLVVGFLFCYKLCKKHVKSILEQLKSISYANQKNIAFYSLLKYLVFSFQFYFCLNCFGIELSYYHTMIILSSMYFISSIIPMFGALDIMVKGSIGLVLFSPTNISSSILGITFLLIWLSNSIIPALIGNFIVINYQKYSLCGISS